MSNKIGTCEWQIRKRTTRSGRLISALTILTATKISLKLQVIIRRKINDFSSLTDFF
jgi:hypothetical protein